jgi:hypothetical protein
VPVLRSSAGFPREINSAYAQNGRGPCVGYTGEGTHAYTLEEAEAICNALVDRPDAQLIFCLAAFLGFSAPDVHQEVVGALLGLIWE